MKVIKSKVIKTEKQEELDENGNIVSYTVISLPAIGDNDSLLFSKNIFVISHSQREGLAIPMEL